jgi:predicted DNA-binding ArsR family transcriptional regulator
MREDSYDNIRSNHLVDFMDNNTDVLLSKDMSKEQFNESYKKLKTLVQAKKVNPISRLLKIRPRHIKAMFNLSFFKKAYTLRKNFLKDVGVIK